MLQDAQQIVLAEKPPIRGTGLALPSSLRDELLPLLSTLASVYHKPPHSFAKRRRAGVAALSDLEAQRAAAQEDGEDGGLGETGLGGAGGVGDLLDVADDAPVRAAHAAALHCGVHCLFECVLRACPVVSWHDA